jgi:protein SCO1
MREFTNIFLTTLYTFTVKRTWLYTLGAVLLVAAGLAAFSLGRILGEGRNQGELAGTAFQTPVSVSDVHLQTNEGDFSFADLKGNVVVVFFGFVRCPDVCPLTMNRLAETYRAIGEPEDLKIVMVTVDPEHDTPEITQNYAGGFHPSFMGLSGTNTQVAEATKRFYIGANITKDGQVIHTDPVLILDRNGNMQRVYSQSSMIQLEQDLPVLLKTL